MEGGPPQSVAELLADGFGYDDRREERRARRRQGMRHIWLECEDGVEMREEFCDISTQIRVDDEITARVSEGAQLRNYKVMHINGDDTLELRDALLPPLTPQANVSVARSWLGRNESQCTFWPFVEDTLQGIGENALETSELPVVKKLKRECRRARVEVTDDPQAVIDGYGLVAARNLKRGHKIPYGGRLAGFVRERSVYNIKVSENVYMVADTLEERGPGAYCNDPRDSDGNPLEGKRVNAKIMTEVDHNDFEAYVDDWARGINLGDDIKTYIQLIEDVEEGTEICVDYGREYWKLDGGQCRSSPIMID